MVITPSTLKPLFHLAIVILYALIPVIIKEQAERKAVGFPVLDNASATLLMVRASRFGAGALFHINTIHSVLLTTITII
jgi:hypothetical protein